MRENPIATVHGEQSAKPSVKKYLFRKGAARASMKSSKIGSFIKKHKIISSIVAVIIVLGVAGGVWWYLDSQQETEVSTSSEVQKAYEEKLPELKKAVSDNPDDPSAHKNYAVALYATGDLGGARKQYEETVKLNDQDAIAYNNLGNVYRDLGKYDDAIEAYETSIKLNDESINTYVNLANVQLYNKGDSDAAIATYEKALKALPDNAQLRLLLGIAYEEAGQKDAARQQYEAILEDDSENAAAQANLDRLNSDK